MKIPRYTFGMGDRFAQQGEAQLSAIQQAAAEGIEVCPVWNKSNREHTIIHSQPDDVRAEADAAVAALVWTKDYFVDADHIGLQTVDRFIAASDFYTLDVADFIGKPATAQAIEKFAASMEKYVGDLTVPGMAEPIPLSAKAVTAAAGKFLLAIQEAGRIYRYVAERKGAENFITEVSIDETDSPQTPVELFLILAMIAQEKIPAQTIAPKFTGRFNKGVEYVGRIDQFEKEFDQDLAVIAFAIEEFGLPETLKLSVHSGSDKFSLYPIINQLVKKHRTGLHVKTAGTTWLEEIIGLAEAGGTGLRIAKGIYAAAYPRAFDLMVPYGSVINIDVAKLPRPAKVENWSSEEYVAALRHDSANPAYDQRFRQFLHVSFKVAVEMGGRFTDALREHREIVARNVTNNLLNRHIAPIFS